MKTPAFAALLALAALLLAPPSATAQTATGWDGTTSADWTDGTNWDNGAPDGVSIRDIFFGQGWFNAGGAGNTTATANSDFDLFRITFEDVNSNGAGDDQAFTVNGTGTLFLYDFNGTFPKIENLSYVTQTISNNVTLTDNSVNAKVEINPINGNLVFNGLVTFNDALDVFGANGNALIFNGGLAGGNNVVTLFQNSAVVLNSAATSTGGFNIYAGRLELGSAGSVGGSITLGNATGSDNAELRLSDSDGGFSENAPILVQAGSSGVKTINSTNSSGVNTLSGNVTMQNGSSVTFSVAAGGTLQLDGGLTGNASGSASNVTKTGAGVLVLNAGIGNRTAVSTTTINEGVVRVQNGSAFGTAAANTIPVTVNGGGALELAGGIALDNGVATQVTHNGTVRSNGTNTMNGRLLVSTAVAANTVYLSTTSAGDVFTIGNGANDVSGGNGTDDTIVVGGPGTIALLNASDYVGNWRFDSGTTQLGAAAALGATPASTVTLNGGTLEGRTTGTTFTLNPITVTANSSLNSGRSAPGSGVNYSFGPLSIGNQTLSVTSTGNVTNGTGGVTVGTTTLTGNATFNVVNGAAATANLTLGNITGAGSLTKAGNGTLNMGGFNTRNYSGGTTLNAGTIFYDEASTVTSNAITGGPFGTGTLTLRGGVLDRGNTSQITYNSLVIDGNATVTSAVNPGSWTSIDPRSVTGGAISVVGNSSLSTNLSGSGGNGTGLTLMGQVTGSGNSSLRILGSGTVTMNNTSGNASTFGNLTIGDAAASGAVGGRLNAANQNSLGSGNITVNFGGRLNPTSNFSPSNAITVKNGGTYNPTGASAGITAPGLVLESGSTIINGSGQVLTLNATQVPTAGVLLNGGANTVAVSGAYNAFTGTMAFGGAGAGSLTTSANTTVGEGQVLAFNQFGGGGMNFNGLVLGGNLTVAGSGGSGTAAIPASPAGTLGSITETGGNRVLTVAMAPTALIGVNSTATGWSGGTVLRGGTLQLNGGVTGPANQFGSGSLTLDGGGVRSTQGSSATVAIANAIVVEAAGGRLEAFNNNGNNPVTVYSGNLTPGAGAGTVMLRYGGTATNGIVLTLSGNNSAFEGGYVVTTSNGRGRVQFTGNSATGGASNVITVESGAMFGFDAFTTLNATIGKFVTTTESILSLEGLGASAVDLSAAGLNRDVRLGASNGLSYNGTLTPYGSAYKFTPSSTLTLNASNQLTGMKDLDVRSGAIAPGAYGVAAGTLLITNSNDYSGNTVVSGVNNNSLTGPGGATGTTLEIGTGGNLTSTASVVVERGATVAVSGTAANAGRISSADTEITARGNGVLRIGNTTASNNNGVVDRIAPTASVTLGGAGYGGGALTMAYSNSTVSQTLADLRVAAGSSTINTTNTSNGTMSLAITGANGTGYTRESGGYVNISSAGNFNVSFTSAPDATNGTVSGTSAPILVGAVLNNVDLVSAASGNLAAPAYTNQTAVGSWGTDENISNNGAAYAGNVSSSVTINSLRMAGVGATGSGNINAGQTLTIASGMILHAGNTTFSLVGPGNVTSGNGDDLILATTNGSANLSISANITGGLALTKVGGGAAALSGNNSIGNITIAGGRLEASSTNALGAVDGNRTIHLQGGTLLLSPAGSSTLNYANTAISVGVGTSAIRINSTGSTVTFGGAITLNGTLGLPGTNASSAGTLVLAGNITGGGAIGTSVGTATNTGRPIFILSGNNSNWTGGINSLLGGASGGGAGHLRIARAASAGTGTIVSAAGGNQNGLYLYLDTDANGSSVYANDFVYNAGQPINVWSLGSGLSASGGNTTTLAGDFSGTGGLIFQGHATADNQVTEIVLGGTVSMSGTPTAYSYGNGTLAQNFVNGQAGMTLGVTARQGTAAVASSSQFDRPGGGTVTDGAEGFVRFDGAQSFIPGAVGPGYLAAVRLAGTGNEARFGYLLTGSANGTTYSLPEGKSFVIGSLGTGAQVGGTLGVGGNGTATLLGAAKLAGHEWGDVNIHANGAVDNQTLTLLARDTGDRLALGNATQAVVFTPTYGDSGNTSAMTLMSARSGATTIKTTGLGTINVTNTAFTSAGGAANNARGSFKWELNGGRLNWNQNDGAGANFARVDVNAGATLGGNGVLNSPVFNNANGTVSPGMSFGNLTIGNYTQAATGALTIEIGARPLVDPTLWDHLFVAGNAILDGVLNIIYNAANNFTGVVGDVWKFLANTTGTRTGNFATTNISATGLAPNTALQVNYLSDGVELQLVSTGNNSTVTYDTWKLAYWPSPDANDDWNDDADLDGNINLVEYALDTDPLTPDLLPVTVGESGGNLTLSYDRPGGANYRSDLVYVTQRTTDLSGTSTLNTDTPTGSDADPTSVSVPSTSAYGSVDREFLDLRIGFTAAPAP
jgi:fibronectin-binding autotransporter adhesin